ncbi:MAG: hypothetical protein WD357_05880 [Gracilimonas sp.]
MDIYNLLSELGVFSIIIAGCAWLLRSIGNHLIDKKFESYKSELDNASSAFQQKLDIELENYRKQLRIDYLKHSRIHEKRLEVMSELYRLLIKLDKNIKNLTAFLRPSTGEDYEERRKREIIETSEVYQTFKNYFDEKRILLTVETCELIDDLNEKYSESLRLSTFKDRWNIDTKTALQMSDEALEIYERQIPKIKRKLEDEFRGQLGSLES